MKVDLSAALKALQASEFVKANDYMVVKVALKANLHECEGLSWELYAYTPDGKNSAWSSDGKTFTEALSDLKEKLRPSDPFIED